MKKITFILFILIINIYYPYSQEIKKYYPVKATIIKNDTIPIIILPKIDIVSTPIIRNKREWRRYIRLVRNVKKVYPYAKLASIKLQEYDVLLKNAKNEKQRRKLMRKAEKEIEDRYGNELRKLTFSQGKILMKLLDRETQHTSYELVEDLRGKFVVFFWQGIARIFGYNLKIKYDPLKKDKDIELIVLMIERGKI